MIADEIIDRLVALKEGNLEASRDDALSSQLDESDDDPRLLEALEESLIQADQGRWQHFSNDELNFIRRFTILKMN